jgi:hypothetical protein
MIRLTCPNCQSKLNAKEELLGQVRKCPKCSHPVQIQGEIQPLNGDTVALDDAAPEQRVVPATKGELKRPDVPRRLNRESIYLICSRTNLVAAWDNKGRGWMLKTDAGMVSAKRNGDQLPAQGDYKLIELKLAITPEGRRLTGLRVYQLALQWALTVLNQDEDQITERITGFGSLNREQKNTVRQAIKDQFMRPVWENASNVLEFLANADCQSCEVN